MKEYKIINKDDYFLEGEKFYISDKLLDKMNEFSVEAFTTLLIIMNLECNNEIVHLKNIAEKVGKTPKTTKRYIDELLNKKYIERK